MAFTLSFSAFRAKKIVSFELHNKIGYPENTVCLFATGALLIGSSAELEVSD